MGLLIVLGILAGGLWAYRDEPVGVEEYGMTFRINARPRLLKGVAVGFAAQMLLWFLR
jgi:hypothetical protein